MDRKSQVEKLLKQFSDRPDLSRSIIEEVVTLSKDDYDSAYASLLGMVSDALPVAEPVKKDSISPPSSSVKSRLPTKVDPIPVENSSSSSSKAPENQDLQQLHQMFQGNASLTTSLLDFAYTQSHGDLNATLETLFNIGNDEAALEELRYCRF